MEALPLHIPLLVMFVSHLCAGVSLNSVNIVSVSVVVGVVRYPVCLTLNHRIMGSLYGPCPTILLPGYLVTDRISHEGRGGGV